MTRVVVLITALAATVHAYDSQCTRADGSACQEGPDAGHNRWLGPSAEHEIIWEHTRLLAGLPPSVSASVDLDVFTGSDTVATAAGALPTLTPAPFAAATRVRRRELTIGELAQLPDFSYALWDWALGNEDCPLNDGSDPITCHDFERHMGPTNSNHFLPQARAFYAHYHGLALGRAAKCLDIAIAVGTQAARFRPLLEACEDEALMLEAVGHHYLQDAWSMGHMWERWGGPDLTAFPDVNTAVAVAMTSGLIHGARAALESKLHSFFQDVPDALCAPAPGVQWWAPGMLAPALGLGDLYYPRLTDPSQPFGEQATRLFSCAAAGMRAVYAAAGQQHGPMEALDPSLRPVDPLSDDCFAQRATNLAMLTGAALDVIENDGTPYRIALDGDFATTLVIAGATHGVPDDAFLARYRLDMANALFRIQVGAAADPDGVQAASGALPPLLGVAPNSAYVKNPPAGYTDPPLPWTSDDMRQTTLVRTFHRAHADDLCRAMGQSAVEPIDLDGLRDRAQAPLPADDHAAAVAVCAELAARHLRFGKDATDYDHAHEPFCAFVQDATAFAYTGQLGDFGPDDFAATRDAAESWCTATTTTTTTTSTTTTTVPQGKRIELHIASVGWSCLGLGQVPNTDPPPEANVYGGGGGPGMFPFSDSGSTSWVSQSKPPNTATVQMDCSGSLSADLTFDAEGNLVGFGGSGSTIGHASLTGDTWYGYSATANMEGTAGLGVWFRVSGGPVAYTIDVTASRSGSRIRSGASLQSLTGIIAQTDPAGGQLTVSGVLQPGPDDYSFGAAVDGIASFSTADPTAVDFQGQWSATLTLTPLPPE